MRTIKDEEIWASEDRILEMSIPDMQAFLAQMSEAQPFIMVYISTLCERDDFEQDNDKDALVNLACAVWDAINKASGGDLGPVSGDDIDRSEERIMQLLETAEGEAEDTWSTVLKTWVDGSNQQPILRFLLEALMSEENSYDVSDEGSGLVFMYLKTIVDCLDDAVEG